MLKIDVGQINSFKNFMQFFQIAKLSNNLGVSSRNKVPDIKDPKDIVSKSATVMSRLLTSGQYAQVREILRNNFVYSIAPTFVKNRTPAGFRYENPDAIAKNLIYRFGISLQSNLISRIAEDKLIRSTSDELKMLVVNSANVEYPTRNYYNNNNLGYYSDTFFRIIDSQDMNIFKITDEEIIQQVANGVQDLKDVTDNIFPIFANLNRNSQIFGDDPDISITGHSYTIFKTHNPKGMLEKIGRSDRPELSISMLPHNSFVKLNTSGEIDFYFSNINLDVKDADVAYAALVGNTPFSNNFAHLFTRHFNYGEYMANQLFGLINRNMKCTSVINFRLRDTQKTKSVMFVVSNAAYKEVNIDINMDLKFKSHVFNNYVTLNQALTSLGQKYNHFINSGFGEQT